MRESGGRAPGRASPASAARASLVARALAAAALTLVAAGCAVRLPPPGGPLDTTPPAIVTTLPESSAVGWDPGRPLEITFSESLLRRSLQDWLFVSPSRVVDSIDWDEKTARVRLRGALEPGRTWQVVVGTGVTDQRNNTFREPHVWTFSTGDTVATGRIAGRLGRPGPGVRAEHLLVWLYPCGGDTTPDLAIRDPAYVTQCRKDSTFAIEGLSPGECWRAYLVHDANRNRVLDSNEFAIPAGPDSLLVPPGPEGLVLDPVRPVDPKSPGRLQGSLADTLAPGDTLFAALLPDTGEATGPAARVAKDGRFRMDRVEPGRYHLHIFRDRDGDSTWDPDVEPGTAALPVRIRPDELETLESLPKP